MSCKSPERLLQQTTINSKPKFNNALKILLVIHIGLSGELAFSEHNSTGGRMKYHIHCTAIGNKYRSLHRNHISCH